jgi:hypothetical protein
MSKKLTIALVVLVVVGAGAWYAFRPERLFINNKVQRTVSDCIRGEQQTRIGSVSQRSA